MLESSSPPLILGTGQRVGSGKAGWEVISLSSQLLMHVHFSGKSGFGKSRALCSLLVMLQHRGIPFYLVDPAGDLFYLLQAQLLSLGFFDQVADPFDQVLFLDVPSALLVQRYLAFNVLQTGHDPYTTANLVLEAFKRAFPALKGGTATNVETLVKLCSYVLAVHNLPLFPQMLSLLTDAAYRQSLLQKVPDALARQFFEQHSNPRTGDLDMGVDSTIKRLFLLAFVPLLRFSLGQRENVLHFPRLLAERKSVVLNLNVPDPEALRLLGSLVTVGVEMAALARGQLPPSQRYPTVLCLDEFHKFVNLSGESFEHILVEARKMGVFLVLANQSFAQIPRELRGALNNCEVRMCFRSERSDAEEAAPLLGFPIDPFMLKPSATTTPHFYSATEQKEMHIQAITKLDKQEAFLRLPGDRLYRMQTLNVPDPVVPAGRLAELQQEYLNRYFRPQAAIEADMASMLQHDSWPGQPKPAGSDVAAGDIISFTPPAYAKNNIQSQTDDGDDEDDLTELRY